MRAEMKALSPQSPREDFDDVLRKAPSTPSDPLAMSDIAQKLVQKGVHGMTISSQVRAFGPCRDCRGPLLAL